MKEVKAVAMGFHKGRRVRPGTKFYVKDDMKRKWFIDVKKNAAPVAASADTNKETSDDPSDLI